MQLEQFEYEKVLVLKRFAVLQKQIKIEQVFKLKRSVRVEEVLNNTLNRNVLLDQREQPRYHHRVDHIETQLDYVKHLTALLRTGVQVVNEQLHYPRHETKVVNEPKEVIHQAMRVVIRLLEIAYSVYEQHTHQYIRDHDADSVAIGNVLEVKQHRVHALHAEQHYAREHADRRHRTLKPVRLRDRSIRGQRHEEVHAHGQHQDQHDVKNCYVIVEIIGESGYSARFEVAFVGVSVYQQENRVEQHFDDVLVKEDQREV